MHGVIEEKSQQKSPLAFILIDGQYDADLKIFS